MVKTDRKRTANSEAVSLRGAGAAGAGVPEGSGRVLEVAAGGAGLGVGGEREAVGEDQRAGGRRCLCDGSARSLGSAAAGSAVSGVMGFIGDGEVRGAGGWRRLGRTSRPAAIAARTAARPPATRISSRAGMSQHSVAFTVTAIGPAPARRTRPRTSSSQEPNSLAAHRSCTDSKNARSTRPTASSRDAKMIRWPERTAGVCVATFAPGHQDRLPVPAAVQVRRADHVQLRPAGRRRTRGRAG